MGESAGSSSSWAAISSSNIGFQVSFVESYVLSRMFMFDVFFFIKFKNSKLVLN